MKLSIVSGLCLSQLLACGVAYHPQTKSAQLKAAGRSYSAFFTTTCTVCHGANGDEGFAPLLSVVDYKDYVYSVRTGHPDKGVPPFTPEEYPLSTLNSDYTAVTGKPAR